VLVGQTLSGLSYQHAVDVRRTPERLAGRGQVPGTVTGVRGHDVRDETSGEFGTTTHQSRPRFGVHPETTVTNIRRCVASELLDGRRRRRVAENRRRQDLVDVATEENEIDGRVLFGRTGHERYIKSGVELSAVQSQVGFQSERVVSIPEQK